MLGLIYGMWAFVLVFSSIIYISLGKNETHEEIRTYILISIIIFSFMSGTILTILLR